MNALLARLKRYAMNFALVCTSLLFVLLVLEIGTRIFTDIIPPLNVSDPVLGKRYQESFETTVFVPEAQREIYLRFNSVGFRGPDRPFAKPEGVRRIAVLGDSMIASLAVDERDTLVNRLEALLGAEPGEQWEVMNFGVSGSSPAQEIVLYRELVSRFDPDIVIVGFFVGNDLADNCACLSNRPRIYFDFDEDGNFQQLPLSQKREAASRFLNRYSRFYVWQKGALRKLSVKARNSLRRFPPGAWIYSRQEPEEVAHAWRVTEATIETLSHEVVSRGGKFIFVIIPSAEQVYEDRLEAVAMIDKEKTKYFDADNPDRRIAGICSKLGISCISMLADFREAAPSRSSKVTEELLFHNGNGHFNERGNELAALAIHRFLANNRTQSDPAAQQ